MGHGGGGSFLSLELTGSHLKVCRERVVQCVCTFMLKTSFLPQIGLSLHMLLLGKHNTRKKYRLSSNQSPAFLEKRKKMPLAGHSGDDGVVVR